MAFLAYMYVEGESGSQIEGWSGEEDRTNDGKSVENLVRVQAFDHSVDIPTDLQTGEATGVAQHRPVRLTCNMDQSCPELYDALTNQARMKIMIYFFRAGGGAKSTASDFHNWFTITLTDARITSLGVRKAMALEGGDMPDLIDVTFRYRMIGWEDHNSKKVVEFDWKKKGK